MSLGLVKGGSDYWDADEHGGHGEENQNIPNVKKIFRLENEDLK